MNTTDQPTSKSSGRGTSNKKAADPSRTAPRSGPRLNSDEPTPAIRVPENPTLGDVLAALINGVWRAIRWLLWIPALVLMIVALAALVPPLMLIVALILTGPEKEPPQTPNQ